MAEFAPGLPLSRDTWRFLERADDYVEAFERENKSELRPLTTRRQMLTAAEILERLRTQPGVLLADDVGLGKTAIAALVACVVAGNNTGDRRMRVRILAPNGVLRRKWQSEVSAHLRALQKVASHLNLGPAERSVNRGRIKKLNPGQIEITTHRAVTKRLGRRPPPLDCDLLIVDEAHKAKNADAQFASRLRRAKNNNEIAGILTLTATPFSISLLEFIHMLTLVGADTETIKAARKFSSLLKVLWEGTFGIAPEAFGDRLADAGQAAVEALRPFVTRVSIDDLMTVEAESFGNCEDWFIPVPNATSTDAALLATTVRILQLGKRVGIWKQERMNDPRFHVGWSHLRDVLCKVEKALDPDDRSADTLVLQLHLGNATKLLACATDTKHAKMAAVADAVREIVHEGEKVLVFCYHLATAAELTLTLFEALGEPPAATEAEWEAAWLMCLENELLEPALRELVTPFVEWLCTPAIKSQVSKWIGEPPGEADGLAMALRTCRPRPDAGHGDTNIAEAARQLLRALEGSPSSRRVLLAGSKAMPGSTLSTRVLGKCIPPDDEEYETRPGLFLQHQPDAILAIFNSPFGPDVLVATDALSEGVDLHGCCRHLVHYELNPSPLSAIQRNGRLRRVNCWAARCKKPLRIAWPRFAGTRDERLVGVVQQRLQQFSLLLGGIRTPADFDVHEEAEKARAVALNRAKNSLKRLSLAPDFVRIPT